jgi:hypothetical protein
MQDFGYEPDYDGPVPEEEDDGIHRESGKKCRSCGRTNCEGGAQCEIATEMRRV